MAYKTLNHSVTVVVETPECADSLDVDVGAVVTTSWWDLLARLERGGFRWNSPGSPAQPFSILTGKAGKKARRVNARR